MHRNKLHSRKVGRMKTLKHSHIVTPAKRTTPTRWRLSSVGMYTYTIQIPGVEPINRELMHPESIVRTFKHMGSVRMSP